MYETWFSLSKRPFQAPPQAVSYFPNDVFESACEGLWRCIQRNAGPGVVIGEHGTGKSLLSLLMANQFQSSWSVVQISAPSVRSRKEFIQTILFELGLPYVAADEGELRLSLLDHLTSARPSHEGTLLIIDDAHDLSIELLEQVASLSGLVRDGRWCIDLVVLGTTGLEEKLAHPALTSLNQRIAARYYLRPWASHVTANYIHHQLAQAGGDAHVIFENPALTQIHELTRGVPRLVNQLCDHCMVLAAAGGVRQIKAAMVQEAWSDLQQLPKDTVGHVISSPVTQDDPIVEFGSLDDEPTPGQQSLQPTLVEKHSTQSRPHYQIGAADELPFPADAADVEDKSPMETWREVFEKPPIACDNASDSAYLRTGTEESTSRMLDEIEQQLMDANNELQGLVAQSPASIGINSNRPANPFYESFADEEIVISRNCLSEVDWMTRQPTVKTTQGTRLIDTLKSLEYQANYREMALDDSADDRHERHATEEFDDHPPCEADLDMACAPGAVRQVWATAAQPDQLNLELRIAYATGDLEPSRDTEPTRHAQAELTSAQLSPDDANVCLAANYPAASSDAGDWQAAGSAPIGVGGVSQVVVEQPDQLAFSYVDGRLASPPPEFEQPTEPQVPPSSQMERQPVLGPHASPDTRPTSVRQPQPERKFSRLFSNLKRQ